MSDSLLAEMSEEKEVERGPRRVEDYADGRDLDLGPVLPIDLGEVGSFSELLAAMKSTSFGGRQLGEAAEVLEEMASDPHCWVVGTFSGAMTVAKQGLVLCDMIDHGLLDAVVSTGALMAHGFVEAAGLVHFKAPEGSDDSRLYRAGFDRVYVDDPFGNRVELLEPVTGSH